MRIAYPYATSLDHSGNVTLGQPRILHLSSRILAPKWDVDERDTYVICRKENKQHDTENE